MVGESEFWSRIDLDGDGYAALSYGGIDCDDENSGIAPGLSDVPYDGIDANCDGLSDFDVDGDGWEKTETAGGDCDDINANIFPSGIELCDGRDGNCDGIIPDNESDSDADGVLACDDCDDQDGERFPGATEICDAVGRDENCDGRANDSDPYVTGTRTWYFDDDGDGFGDPDVVEIACEAPAEFVEQAGDCDDADPAVYDGVIHFNDADGDGWGDDAIPVDACDGGVGVSEDCDDGDATVNPGAVEVCGGGDEDCDGQIDEADSEPPEAARWYLDADGDGFGWAGTRALSCAPLVGYAQDSTDCDDTSTETFPGAAEICGGGDEDCDGWVDDDDADVVGQAVWYADVDQDGFGDESTMYVACFAKLGDSNFGADCAPEDGAVHPEADEVCGGGDEDCDGLTDDTDPSVSDPTVWFADTDADGWGDSTAVSSACVAAEGFVGTFGDCDDKNRDVSPSGLEDCATEADDNCDGAANEATALGCSQWYRDADADGYGASEGACACAAVGEWSAETSDDCDDENAAFHPDLAEVCADGGDTNCDGAADVCEVETAARMLSGEAEGDWAGEALGGVGDVNGDGLDDFVVASQDSGETGRVHLAYGGGAGDLDLSASDAIFYGVGAGDKAGFAVSGAGDLNADGIADVLVGAPFADTSGEDAGDAYVVLGPITGDVDLTHADTLLMGYQLFALFGLAVSGGGDVDGDGFDDLAIGAPQTIPAALGYGAWAGDGAVMMYFGPLAAHEYAIRPGLTVLGGGVGDFVGGTVALVPDWDGDGLTDLAVAAKLDGAGSVFLLTGVVPGSIRILETESAARFGGEALGDEAGTFVGTAGDIDGDGRADLQIGAPGNNGDSGALYIALGGTTGEVSLAQAHANIRGVAAGDSLGLSAAGVGDLNGDGSDDIAIGAPGADGADSEAGAVWLMYGPIAGAAELSGGERLEGVAGGNFGYAVASSGDTNGDGRPDLLVGAPTAEGVEANSGAAWLFLGGGR